MIKEVILFLVFVIIIVLIIHLLYKIITYKDNWPFKTNEEWIEWTVNLRLGRFNEEDD